MSPKESEKITAAYNNERKRLLGLGFITLTVFLVMTLWNSLIPKLFQGPVLTFWQTAGL